MTVNPLRELSGFLKRCLGAIFQAADDKNPLKCQFAWMALILVDTHRFIGTIWAIGDLEEESQNNSLYIVISWMESQFIFLFVVFVFDFARGWRIKYYLVAQLIHGNTTSTDTAKFTFRTWGYVGCSECNAIGTWVLVVRLRIACHHYLFAVLEIGWKNVKWQVKGISWICLEEWNLSCVLILLKMKLFLNELSGCQREWNEEDSHYPDSWSIVQLARKLLHSESHRCHFHLSLHLALW